MPDLIPWVLRRAPRTLRPGAASSCWRRIVGWLSDRAFVGSRFVGWRARGLASAAREQRAVPPGRSPRARLALFEHSRDLSFPRLAGGPRHYAASQQVSTQICSERRTDRGAALY